MYLCFSCAVNCEVFVCHASVAQALNDMQCYIEAFQLYKKRMLRKIMLFNDIYLRKSFSNRWTSFETSFSFFK